MTLERPYSSRRSNFSLKPRRLRLENLEQRAMMSGSPLDSFAAWHAAMPLVGPKFVDHAATHPTQSPTTQQTTTQTTQTTSQADALDRFTSVADLRQYLIDQAARQYQGMFGTSIYSSWGGIVCYDQRVVPLVFASAGTAITNTAQTSPSSRTNTQVAGVDEADLMETDGNYLYMLSQGELVVVDLRVADAPSVAARLKLQDSPSAMYLSGDRLTLISSGYGGLAPMTLLSSGTIPSYNHTTVTIVDVSDRTMPQVVSRNIFDGVLLDSRAIGDRVVLVFQPAAAASLDGPHIVHADGTPLGAGENPYPYYYYLPQVRWTQPGFMSATGPRSPTQGGYRYETEQEYRQRMATLLAGDFLPQYVSYDATGHVIASGDVCAATSIYKPAAGSTSAVFTTVATIDMGASQPGPADAIAVPTGYSVKIYASTTGLYLLDSQTGSPWLLPAMSTGMTIIDKIDLAAADGKLQLAARGSVKGSVLDQFSADESDGYFRIATTEGWAAFAGDPTTAGTSQAHLFVLQQSGTSLNVVSSIDNLAPDERIYSVRFQGTKAFVVTFRSVDPLFAIDLSNPASPSVAGTLDMPGYSNYLQPVGDGFLVGVGRNVGSDGYYQDPQVSLFNTSDLANPQLVSRLTIPSGRTGGADIFYDHHVVSYYADQGILTVSVPETPDDSLGWWYSVNDLYVFRVDTTSATPGLTLLGTIKHDDSVLRSVEAGGRLISISENKIEIHDFANPAAVVASLAINSGGINTWPIYPMPIFLPLANLPALTAGTLATAVR